METVEVEGEVGPTKEGTVKGEVMEAAGAFEPKRPKPGIVGRGGGGRFRGLVVFRVNIGARAEKRQGWANRWPPERANDPTQQRGQFGGQKGALQGLI